MTIPDLTTVYNWIEQNIQGGILNFAQWISSVLPPSNGLPDEFASGIYYIGDYAKSLSFIIPFRTIFLALGIVIAFEIIAASVKLSVWLIPKVIDILKTIIQAIAEILPL